MGPLVLGCGWYGTANIWLTAWGDATCAAAAWLPAFQALNSPTAKPAGSALTGGVVVVGGIVVVVVLALEPFPPPDDATTAMATTNATMAIPSPTSPTVIARPRPDEGFGAAR